MRVMCLDVGKVRVGVAQSDPLKIIASPLEVYKRTNSIKADAKHIVTLIKNNEVDTLVIGLPLKMDGTSGESVEMAKEFGERIKNYLPELNLVYQDERFSTVSATRILLEGDVSRDKRKQVVDKVASTIILQNYLDKIKK